MSYDEYRATKIESGLLYQDFVVDVLFQTIGLVIVQYTSRAYQIAVGESRTGVEIKHDEKYATTGNLWIEVAEKARPRPGDYADAGINRGDNSWLYVIGDYDRVFIFGKRILVALSQSGRYKLRENRTKTSIGYLLPGCDAEKYALYIINPNAKEKVAKMVGDLEALGRALHRAVLADPAQRSLFPETED